MENHERALDSNEQTMSRRECLAWLARASAVVVVGGAIQCAHADDEARAGSSGIANLMNIASGTAREIQSLNVILVRSEKGVACMSITCTHRKTKLDVDKDGGISCPAPQQHLRFRRQVHRWPGDQPPSTRYRTTIAQNGDISVDVSSTVKPGEWTDVPDWAKPKK